MPRVEARKLMYRILLRQVLLMVLIFTVGIILIATSIRNGEIIDGNRLIVGIIVAATSPYLSLAILYATGYTRLAKP